MTYPIDLVIFDFDGVLIDSEYLSAKIAAKLINEAGCKITIEELCEHYSGYVFKDILKDLEQKTESYFSASIIEKMQQKFIKAIPHELKLIDGIIENLNKIDVNFCICSNASNADIELILKNLNIWHLFEGKIFSAPDTGTKQLKPSPDIFLYAAEQYNVAPNACLVIEDSVPGILAAKKANMRVVGFTGGSHTYQKHSNVLSEAGAETVYCDHADLPNLIQAMREWKDS